MKRSASVVLAALLFGVVTYSGHVSSMDDTSKVRSFKSDARIMTVIRVDSMDVWYGAYADMWVCKNRKIFDTSEGIKALKWAFVNLKWQDDYGRVTIDEATLDHLALLTQDKTEDDDLIRDNKLNKAECDRLQNTIQQSKVGMLYRER